MGIHYTQPVAEYDSSRVDSFNRKLTRQDYFVPEYDNLGLQSVLRMDAVVEPDSTLNTNNDVLGFAPRYNEYKSLIRKGYVMPLLLINWLVFLNWHLKLMLRK